MKRVRWPWVVGALALGGAAFAAVTIPPGSPVARKLTYSGVLEFNDGGPVANGTYAMAFHLTDADGGSVWLTRPYDVDVEDGRFTATLGEESYDAAPQDGGIPDQVFETKPLYISPVIQGDELSRQQVTSAPFAVRAEKAQVAVTTERLPAPVAARINGFRLSVHPSNPLSDDSGSVLHLLRFSGDAVAIFNTMEGYWQFASGGGATLDLSAAPATSVHDIFVTRDASGNAQLQSIAWGGSVRTQALAQLDGAWVAASDSGRRYVGSVYIETFGTLNDLPAKRFVFNVDNQVWRASAVDPGNSPLNATPVIMAQLQFLVGLPRNAVRVTGNTYGAVVTNGCLITRILVETAPVGAVSRSVAGPDATGVVIRSYTPLQGLNTVALDGSVGCGVSNGTGTPTLTLEAWL